jgi:hypothetical protein
MLAKNKSLSSQAITVFKCLVLLCLFCIILQSYKKLVVVKTNPTINQSNHIIRSKFMSRYDLLINENEKDIRSVYYRHATAARNTSYPFISGDTYRAFADFVFDETRQDNLQSVKYGDSVFVKADMFPQFFSQPYESIKHPFVLITHNSDFSAPGNFRARLEDKKIIAWYAINLDIRQHSKLFPIPIGLANTRWPSGNLTKLMYAFKNHRKPWANRTIFLYANFNLKTNPGQRKAALDQIAKFKNPQTVSKSVPFENYLENIGNAKFVLSPPGNGLDCHRTWEALLLGAVPVVLSSGLDPLFNEIPAIVINNWKNLTEEFLLSHNFSSYDSLTPIVLYARYWRDTLLKHRDKSS